MRALKRHFYRIWGEIRIAPRRRAIAAALRDYLCTADTPKLVLSGSRGQDSIYIVKVGTDIRGVLRLLNPTRRRKSTVSDLPFMQVPDEARIQRERAAYVAGFAAGLTPEPLWSTTDALFCAYLPLRPMHEILRADPARAWELVLAASLAVRVVHALGVVHADMSLANTLSDSALAQVVLVDFEYMPAPHVTPAAAKLYDYLRLLESTWKFMPDTLYAEDAAWLSFLATVITPDMTLNDLRVLTPALPKLHANKVIFDKISGLLSPA